MAATNTTMLTYRIEPSLTEAVRKASVLEHRSIANIIEVMIHESCARMGIAAQKMQALVAAKQKSPA